MKHTISSLLIALLLTSSLYAGDFPQLKPQGWTLINTTWDTQVPPTIGHDQSNTQIDTKNMITNPFPPMLPPEFRLFKKSFIKPRIIEDLSGAFVSAQKNTEFITNLKVIYAQRAIATTYIADEITFADDFESVKEDRRKERNRNLRKNSYRKKLHTVSNVPHAIYNDPKSENDGEKVHEKKHFNNLPQYRLPKKEIYDNKSGRKAEQAQINTHADQAETLLENPLAIAVLICHHFLQPNHTEQSHGAPQKAQQLNLNSLGFINRK